MPPLALRRLLMMLLPPCHKDAVAAEIKGIHAASACRYLYDYMMALRLFRVPRDTPSRFFFSCVA